MDANKIFDAPIPGMSLTTEPRNRPWENPPKMVDVDEVINHYIPLLGEEERSDDLMLLLEEGVAVNFLVDSMITTATMQGLHTLEAGLLAAPVLSEVIMAMADLEGVEYTRSYDDIKGSRKAKPAEVKRAMKLLEEEEFKALKGEPKQEEVEEPAVEEKPKKRGIAIIASAEPMMDEVEEDGI